MSDDSSSNLSRHRICQLYSLLHLSNKCHYAGNPLLVVTPIPKSTCPSHHYEKAMANAINFTGQAPRQSFCFRSMDLNFLPFKPSFKLEQQKMNMEQHAIRMRRPAKSKPSIIVSSTNVSDFEPNPLSASELIREFYECINEKNLKQLDAYISDDCCFQDCSFINPFKGKKDVMQFFEQLTASMGQNMKFSVEHVCEGDEFIAGAKWHLEWKKTQIPLTKGCSFYEFSIDGERPLIKKAQVIIESPIKPGGIVLTLLKNLNSLFDDFPSTTEWLLKSPQVILHHLVKIYTTFLAGFINPIINGYIRMWNFMIRLLGLALKILVNILKMFLK